MFVAWGQDLRFLCNDAYAAILGAKHPEALGKPFQEVWAEIWSDIGPLVEAARAGNPTWHEDLPLILNRNGEEEQAWFTFSYSPVRDDGGEIAGMFCVCTETTAKVRAARRQAFQAAIDARLRTMDNFEEIAGTASELLARELGSGPIDVSAAI